MILFVGQREGRGDGNAVAGMYAHRVEILDRADDDDIIFEVAHYFELELFPSDDGLLDEHLADRAHRETPFHLRAKLFDVVGDVAAGSAHRKRGAHNRREADSFEFALGLGQGGRHPAVRHAEADLPHGLPKRVAVFGFMNGLDRCADQPDAIFVQDSPFGQSDGRVQGRLSTHGRQERIRPLAFNHLLHYIQRDRFNIGPVGKIRVRHDRGRIAVDQDDAVALLLQGFAGLGA